MDNPLSSRRGLFESAARRFFKEHVEGALDSEPRAPNDAPPRLTLQALEAISMSRSRERILNNLDEMYREAFERAKLTEDPQQMTALDFAYRREQLYFEILLDVRDGLERLQR
jgi:hypothetical protein